MPRIIAIILAVALGLGVGFLLGQAQGSETVEESKISCPAEDSCEIDYRDGAWWLRTFDDNSDEQPGPWVRVSK